MQVSAVMSLGLWCVLLIGLAEQIRLYVLIIWLFSDLAYRRSNKT